jgi:hypothetical protein
MKTYCSCSLRKTVLVLVLVLCPTQRMGTTACFPSRQAVPKHRAPRPLLMSAQEWTLAEASNDPTMPLPDWWRITEPQVVVGRLTPSSPTWTIRNPSPLWVAAMAHIIQSCLSPSLFSVTPVFGYLAPSGGTTNLCNEAERYQSFCDFSVQFPNNVNEAEVEPSSSPAHLLIQTEEGESWMLELAGN